MLQTSRDLQLLPVPTNWLKNLLIDFVIDILVSTNEKDENYKLILASIDRLTKIVYYKLVKITINALGLIKVIIDMVVYYQKISKSIITD